MKKILFSLFILLIQTCLSAQQQTATDIVTKSIAYHDPSGLWKRFQGTLQLTEIREKGNRSTQFSIDNQIGKFLFERDSIKHGMLLDSCFNVSGHTPCDRVETIRNYYLYLWGLPMKLKDRNTPLQDKVQTIDNWYGVPAYGMEVHYERENWTFFFSQKDYRLLGYQFFFNYKDGGELILLENELEFDGIKFPKERTWHSLPGEKYLAKDILEKVK